MHMSWAPHQLRRWCYDRAETYLRLFKTHIETRWSPATEGMTEARHHTHFLTWKVHSMGLCGPACFSGYLLAATALLWQWCSEGTSFPTSLNNSRRTSQQMPRLLNGTSSPFSKISANMLSSEMRLG